MTALSINAVMTEWVNFLRNSDIFTITQRGAVTDTDTGALSSDIEIVIDVSNVKNVRSVVVGGVTLDYGYDYTIDTDYSTGGSTKLRIAFVTAQTGAYTVTYDYGSDKIYPDFPREDISIANFPRIGCGMIDMPTEIVELSGTTRPTLNLTTVIYAKKASDLYSYIDALRVAVLNNKGSFYYVGRYVLPISIGPILKAPRESGKEKILQQNLDIQGRFYFET